MRLAFTMGLFIGFNITVDIVWDPSARQSSCAKIYDDGKVYPEGLLISTIARCGSGGGGGSRLGDGSAIGTHRRCLALAREGVAVGSTPRLTGVLSR
jgi:hypothetical protein